MAANGGLVTRRAALEAGLPPDHLRRLVARGAWRAVRRGVYCTAEHWAALDDRRGRPLLQCRAAGVAMFTPFVASHDWAALEHGLDLLDSPRRMPHVTRFGVLGSRTEHGVKHHLAGFDADQVVRVGPFAVLDVARTVADIAREHGLRHGLVAADSARRRGLAREDLQAAVVPMRSWPGVTAARASVALSDPGADNPAETLARLLLHELGHDEVETQFGLTDGTREAWCDLRVGRHVLEVDGRAKYRPTQEGGFARRGADDVLWREKRRQDWLVGFGLGVTRLTWADLQPAQWEATKRRVARELELTRTRLGSDVGDLRRYVVRRSA